MPTRHTISTPHEDCQYHLDYAGSTCPGCSEFVNEYGNTESVFRYCSFPDCGCDGARLCMAGEASERAAAGNVEGMWSGTTPEGVKARRQLIIDTMLEKKP